ncbi:hypothetical protein ABKV19_008209 [Rosa sericea]
MSSKSPSKSNSCRSPPLSPSSSSTSSLRASSSMSRTSRLRNGAVSIPEAVRFGFRSKVIVKLKYADLVSILPTNVSVVVWPIQIWRFSVNISTMNTLEGPTCLLYAEDALRTMSLPEEIVLNLPYKLFGKCTKSPLNITLVNAAEFVQSHSKNWFREKDSSLI